MRKTVDFLVLGSGIAGLSFALKVAKYGKVCILTKAAAEDAATKYAQGGIAGIIYNNMEAYEKHIKDTLIAGDGLCNEDVVRFTIQESTERIKDLIEWGVNFDKDKFGKYELMKEGGHSDYRILHKKDRTGLEIETVLLAQAKRHPNIEILENHYTIDIITQHHLGKIIDKNTPDIRCFGVYALNTISNSIDTYLSKVTLVATGGAGMVYSTTTNPVVSTGDGIAMCSRANAVIENMEFIQFHPTSLYNPNERPSFLISEALRGFGAILKTIDGIEFMQKYDKRLSLAPRDIVARAIDMEMKIRGDEYVYLDCRHLDKDDLIEHFPGIYIKCLSNGIDITKDMLPVIPAAHYICGGIKVDSIGRSSIINLYASGECSSTGLHGANRLASNSLLEALVFSHRAAEDAIAKINNIDFVNDIPDWNAEGMVMNEEMVLIIQTSRELQAIMSNYVGIVRSDLRLKRALDRLNILFRETEDLYNISILSPQLSELRNLIKVAYLIIKMAAKRKESCGLHFSINYPRIK
ncbi:MAG: L-aspartate oxidase [Bacteroidales bacterium]|nr:L-aspartate oxidase [Bacteroidales bacterium]